MHPDARRLGADLKDSGDPQGPLEPRRGEASGITVPLHLIEGLHVGNNHDRGGNDLQVRFYRSPSRLGFAPDRALEPRRGPLAGRAVGEGRRAGAVLRDGRTLEEWATETHQAARQAYQDQATGLRIEAGDRLGKAYYESNLPLARRQTLKASARLAWVLTDTLSPR
jgi:hypothetical protein